MKRVKRSRTEATCSRMEAAKRSHEEAKCSFVEAAKRSRVETRRDRVETRCDRVEADCSRREATCKAFSLYGRVMLVAACALLSGFLLLAGTATAHAEDDDNFVNPQQLPDSSFIYDTSIIDLSTADAYYNEQTVQVVGEVVGDSIKVGSDDSHRWITLISATDPKTNATVVVYMSEEAASRIDSYGKYGTTGTVLRVRGTYHLACSDHDGLSDIHAEYVSVVQKGKQSTDSFEALTFVPGLITVVVGLIMLAVFYYIRERRR